MRQFAVSALVTVGLVGAAPAQAGLWDNIYQGLDYFVTPSGSPVTTAADGTRFNGQRSGRLRVVPDRVGNGYTLELDRTFGGDSTGRPEVLDLGPYELELSGAVQSTFGFTRRFLPAGNAQIDVAGLNYQLRGKSGAQDFVLSGTLNGSQALEINPLGFYTLDLNVNNTNSDLTLDGVLVEGTQDTDFDIGPITIQGNAYYDTIVSLLSSFGVDTSGLEQLFPSSPIDRITQNITESIASQAKSLGERIDTDLVSGIQDPALAADSQRFVQGLVSSVVAEPAGGPGAVPEPSTLALIVAGGLVAARAWRRDRA